MVKPYTLHLGNCLDTLKTYPDNSIDSIVTDPPYGISFMSKKWDYDVPSVEIWKECLRVLKPGGFLLSFSSTRTYHRMTTNIEDAGFEIRDSCTWNYSSGFPKSHNISASIDKMYGHPNRGRAIPTASSYQACDEEQENKLTSNPVGPYEPKTDEAKQWQGWGTALKPSQEFIAITRKPLDGTVANNVLTWGTGGINIDGCRVGHEKRERLEAGYMRNGRTDEELWLSSYGRPKDINGTVEGRWPANFIHDGSEEVLELFPQNPSAARFFYCSKANKKDRNEGLEGLEPKQYSHDGREVRNETAYQRNDSVAANHHPTVKPTDLMCYLVRMVTRKGCTVLDPFMGSGTTGKAAMREGMNFIGCELDAEYLAIAEKRIQYELDKRV